MKIYQPLQGAEANNASNQEIKVRVTVSFRHQYSFSYHGCAMEGGGGVHNLPQRAKFNSP